MLLNLVPLPPCRLGRCPLLVSFYVDKISLIPIYMLLVNYPCLHASCHRSLNVFFILNISKPKIRGKKRDCPPFINVHLFTEKQMVERDYVLDINHASLLEKKTKATVFLIELLPLLIAPSIDFDRASAARYIALPPYHNSVSKHTVHCTRLIALADVDNAEKFKARFQSL